MSGVLVLAEHRQGALREVTLEAIGAARSLPGAEVAVALPGAAARDLAGPLAAFAPRVLLLADERLDHYAPRPFAAAIAEVVAREGFETVLLPHSYHGMDLAGRLAAELDRACVTDVIGLEAGDGSIVAYRAVYGGKVEARVELPAGEPALISVRPTAFPAAEALPAPGTVSEVVPDAIPEDPGLRFLEYVTEAAGDVDITAADVVVAVGRGIGEEENLGMMAELAEALGGVLACSRPIVDRGWMPRDRQVGTSGKTVRPKIYIAVGISGAFQHVAGMKGAARVIAVNRDPHAPIFKAADYGIVGDLFTVVPALTKAARSR